MRRLRRESGQAAVLTAVFLVVLLGMAAFVLDVGSWFRAKRATQADRRRDRPRRRAGAARTDPVDRHGRRGTSTPSRTAAASTTHDLVSSDLVPNDTVTVNVSRTAPGFFSKLFGIDSVTVGAAAAAHGERWRQAKYVAPIVVNKLHPMLKQLQRPVLRLGLRDDLPLGKTGAPGAFALAEPRRATHRARSEPPTLAELDPARLRRVPRRSATTSPTPAPS